MRKRVALIVGAALMVGGSAACSSEHAAANRDPETLPPGAAKVTVDGHELAITHAVHCAPAEQYLTTITTGTGASGATIMVSNAQKLAVESVQIRNLNGFTGDYHRGQGDAAAVSLTGNTYHIAGAAFGYGPKSPVPTSEPFAITVSC